MRGAFGKPFGVAARVGIGQILLSIRCREQHASESGLGGGSYGGLGGGDAVTPTCGASHPCPKLRAKLRAGTGSTALPILGSRSSRAGRVQSWGWGEAAEEPADEAAGAAAAAMVVVRAAALRGQGSFTFTSLCLLPLPFPPSLSVLPTAPHLSMAVPHALLQLWLRRLCAAPSSSSPAARRSWPAATGASPASSR